MIQVILHTEDRLLKPLGDGGRKTYNFSGFSRWAANVFLFQIKSIILADKYNIFDRKEIQMIFLLNN